MRFKALALCLVLPVCFAGVADAAQSSKAAKRKTCRKGYVKQVKRVKRNGKVKKVTRCVKKKVPVTSPTVSTLATSPTPTPESTTATPPQENPPPPGLPAFRVTDIDLRDPHVYANVQYLGATDVTDGFFGNSLNDQLAKRLSSDEDGDGYLDFSPVTVFDPLDPKAPTTPMEIDIGARCTAKEPVVCKPNEPEPTTGTNSSSATCLDVLPGTTYGPYTPEVTASTAPCFSTEETDLTFDLAGIPLSLEDVRVAATYVGDPVTAGKNGLIRGFISETTADATIIPSNVPLAGGKPLSSVLPGGKDCPAAHDDRDEHEGVTGWWFYFNLSATKTTWEP
jgi:hypothetical protein